MTSRFEGLPMTLLETKPYKLPIVSFKCKTGPAEVVEDGVNGYLIEDGDINAMAKAIEELIKNQKRRREFSKNALKNAEKFDYNNIIKSWHKLLDLIVGDPN